MELKAAAVISGSRLRRVQTVAREITLRNHEGAAKGVSWLYRAFAWERGHFVRLLEHISELNGGARAKLLSFAFKLRSAQIVDKFYRQEYLNGISGFFFPHKADSRTPSPLPDRNDSAMNRIRFRQLRHLRA
jgi:hypothetical protein